MDSNQFPKNRATRVDENNSLEEYDIDDLFKPLSLQKAISMEDFSIPAISEKLTIMRSEDEVNIAHRQMEKCFEESSAFLEIAKAKEAIVIENEVQLVDRDKEIEVSGCLPCHREEEKHRKAYVAALEKLNESSLLENEALRNANASLLRYTAAVQRWIELEEKQEVERKKQEAKIEELGIIRKNKALATKKYTKPKPAKK